MNLGVFIGRFTKDPEIKIIESTGNYLTRFTIAVKRRYAKDKAETDFFNCVTFGKTAEFISKHLKKGYLIAIQGEIHINSYLDSQNIQQRFIEIFVQKVNFCDSKDKNYNEINTTSNENGEEYYIKESISDDEILF